MTTSNEMNSSSVPKYSEDILTFDHMVDVLTSGGRWGNWQVAAGDMEFEWDADEKEMRTFYSKIAPKVNVMPLRSSSDIEDDSVEYDFETKNEALRWAYSQRTDMWLSRPPIPSMPEGAGCCESCVEEGLHYAKSLGDAARNGYDVILQDIKLSNVAPNMEFFIALLHKQLMGSVVLDTITTTNDDEFAHFYTHCTANASSEMAGSITIFGINMDEEEMSVIAKMMQRPREGEILEYILQVRNNEMVINDEPASMNNQPFPHIRPIRAKKPITLTLPPRSVGFWIVPANSKACAGAYSHSRKYNTNKIFKLRRTSSTNLLEELILESLNNKQYKFVEELHKHDNEHSMKTSVPPQKLKSSENINQDFIDNQIACRIRGDDVDTRKYEIKRPLSKLMPSISKETQEDTSAEDKEKNRTKRDLNPIKKSLYKHTFEFTKNVKKPSISLYGTTKKNSAERSLFDNRENEDLPTGDVYAAIGKNENQDYDYVQVEEDSEEFFDPNTQFSGHNEPQYLDEDDEFGFNDNQEDDAYMSDMNNLPGQTNYNGREFVELGTFPLYENVPQQETEYMPENVYQERYRYPRSIREKRVKREPFHIMNNNNGISDHNTKSLLSKRKQKLHKNGNKKKWMLKKYYDSDTEKAKNHEEHILNNEIATKVSESNGIRSKRSLKSKRKGKSKKTSAQYKGQKVKRQAEASTFDAQANQHVKSIPSADDKTITKFAEYPGIEVIKSNFGKIKDTVDKSHVALQNHLKETKEKTEKVLNLNNPLLPLNLPMPELITLKPLEFPNGLLDVDMFNKESPIARFLPNNHAMEHDKHMDDPKPKLESSFLGSTMLKSLSALDTQSLTEKINKDIMDLKGRLNEILDSKLPHENLILPGLAGLEKHKERGEHHKRDTSKVYQPRVEVTKARNKRKPLFVEHKEKMQIISQKAIDDTQETEHNIRKREVNDNDITQASSAENMIFSNSIEHEMDEDSAQSSNEIAHEIIIIDELNNTENPEIKGEEAIIIRNIEGDNVETEQIVLTKNENKSLEEMPQPSNLAYSTNLIDDVAHKITHFVTYLHSKIKHWWS